MTADTTAAPTLHPMAVISAVALTVEEVETEAAEMEEDIDNDPSAS